MGGAGSIQQWKDTHFSQAELLNPEISGNLADPDEDGMANLLEYAFDQNPRSASTPVDPPIALARTETGWKYVYRKLRSDLLYRVEASQTLKDFSSQEINQQGVDSAAIGSEIIVTVPTGAEAMFIRLSVTPL